MHPGALWRLWQGEATGRGGGPRLKAVWRVWQSQEGAGGGDSGPGYCLRPPPPAFARPLVSQRKHASKAREALERENTRLWEHAYRPYAAYALWSTWLAWLEEYRELLITTQEVYEAHHG